MNVSFENFNSKITLGNLSFELSQLDLFKLVKTYNKSKVNFDGLSTTAFDYKVSIDRQRFHSLFNEYMFNFIDDICLYKSNVDKIYLFDEEDIKEAFSETSVEVLNESVQKRFNSFSSSLEQRVNFINKFLSNPDLKFTPTSLNINKFGISFSIEEKGLNYIIDEFEAYIKKIDLNFVNEHIKQHFNDPTAEFYFKSVIPAALNIKDSDSFISFVNTYCTTFKIKK